MGTAVKERTLTIQYRSSKKKAWITMNRNEFDLVSVFRKVRDMLLWDRLSLINVTTEKTLREGTSAVLAADLLAERQLVPAACEVWPGLPVLCEEAENSGLQELENIILLPYRDDVVDLPPDYISVDGLDGSALYANGETSLVGMSIGVIRAGKPCAGIIMMLCEQAPPYTVGFSDYPGVVRGITSHKMWREPYQPLDRSLIGLDDNKAVESRFRQLVINKLMGSSGTRYPLNVPSVAGAIKVLQGRMAAYVTSNARNWDIAGTAALCEAANMIVCCLDGSPIPWYQVRMPPVVFARDEEAFTYIQNQAAEYLAVTL